MALPSPSLCRVCWILGILTASSICGSLPSPSLCRDCWIPGIMTAPSIFCSDFTISWSRLFDPRHSDCIINLWICLLHLCWILGILTASSICGSAFAFSPSSLLNTLCAIHAGLTPMSCAPLTLYKSPARLSFLLLLPSMT